MEFIPSAFGIYISDNWSKSDDGFEMTNISKNLYNQYFQ